MIQTEQSAPAVELIGVTKCYGKATAIDNLTLSIPRGTTLGLVGPSGAGKSTTIRTLLGLLRPTAGAVRVLGLDVPANTARIRGSVGYVPERHDLYPWMTVAEVIAGGSFRHDLDRSDAGELL